MKILDKCVEIMKTKNEASLLQNAIMTLENELQELDMHHEGITLVKETSEKEPRRHLPDIPNERSDHLRSEKSTRLKLV